MTGKLIRNQNGFSILEVVLAAAILGLTVAAVISFQSGILKQSQVILQRSSLVRVVYSVQEDLMKEIENLPFRKNANFFNGTTFDQAAYEASFDDKEAHQACFDSEGRPLKSISAPNCAIRLSFYRLQEVDRNYQGMVAVAGTSFNYVPMSRLFIRVKILDSSNNTERMYYFSRLKTHVLPY